MYQDSPIAGRLRKTVAEVSKSQNNKEKSIVKTKTKNKSTKHVTESVSQYSSTNSFVSEYFIDDVNFQQHDQEKNDHDYEDNKPNEEEEQYYNPDEDEPENFDFLNHAMVSVSVDSTSSYTPIVMSKTGRGFPRAHHAGYYYVIARKTGKDYILMIL